MGKEGDCAGNAVCTCFSDVEGVASVVLRCTSDVPPINTMRIPYAPIVRVFVNDYSAARRGEWGCIVVECAIELRLRG